MLSWPPHHAQLPQLPQQQQHGCALRRQACSSRLQPMIEHSAVTCDENQHRHLHVLSPQLQPSKQHPASKCMRCCSCLWVGQLCSTAQLNMLGHKQPQLWPAPHWSAAGKSCVQRMLHASVHVTSFYINMTFTAHESSDHAFDIRLLQRMHTQS
jgi:hypothetical protein